MEIRPFGFIAGVGFFRAYSDHFQERKMDWLASAGTYEQAFEVVCCFFTLIAVFASYLFTLRV